jgi:acetyl esterase/lipase
MADPDEFTTPSFRARLVRKISQQYFENRVSAEHANVPAMRARLDRFARLVPVAAGVDVDPVEHAGLKAEWIRPALAPSDSVILYLHGGAYALGSCDSHRHLVSHIAREAGIRALLPEYRLAPENRFPAALSDATRAYQQLLDDGYAPHNIVIAGDSAGGGLTMATLLNIRDLGLRQPALGCLLSPWLDLAAEGESMQTRRDEDPWFSPEDLPHVTRLYCDDSELRSPLVSPVYADPAGLCPIHIQVGDHEILLSDSERLAENVRRAGGEVGLEVWPDMWHVFQAFVVVMPESQLAVARLGARIRKGLGAAR